MIRDTSGTGPHPRRAAPAKPRAGKRLLIGGGAAVALLLRWPCLTLGRWLERAAARSAASACASPRSRRGTLVRDVAVHGRVVAAVSPTLYAPAAGTVDAEGAGRRRRQARARRSPRSTAPSCAASWRRKQSTLASLEAEARRAALDAQLVARRPRASCSTRPRSSALAAQRDLERYQRGFDGGAVPQVDLAKAQDDLKKAEIGLAAARKDYGLQGQGAGLDTRNKRLLAERQRAIVAELQRQVDELNVRSPVDGLVGTVADRRPHRGRRQRAAADRGRPARARSRAPGAGKLRRRPRPSACRPRSR